MKKLIDKIVRFYYCFPSFYRIKQRIRNFFYYGWTMHDHWDSDCGGFLYFAVRTKCRRFIKAAKKQEVVYEDSEKSLKAIKRLEGITNRLILGLNYRDTKYTKKLDKLQEEWRKLRIGSTCIGNAYIEAPWKSKKGEYLGTSHISFEIDNKEFQGLLTMAKEIRTLQTKIFDIYGKREAKDEKDFKRLMINFDQYEY